MKLTISSLIIFFNLLKPSEMKYSGYVRWTINSPFSSFTCLRQGQLCAQNYINQRERKYWCIVWEHELKLHTIQTICLYQWFDLLLLFPFVVFGVINLFYPNDHWFLTILWLDYYPFVGLPQFSDDVLPVENVLLEERDMFLWAVNVNQTSLFITIHFPQEVYHPKIESIPNMDN